MGILYKDSTLACQALFLPLYQGMAPHHSPFSSLFSRVVILFLVVRCLTYVAGWTMARVDPDSFDRTNYETLFFHRPEDPRMQPDAQIPFKSLWNYGDSEWYLSIAEHGYPTRSEFDSVNQSGGVVPTTTDNSKVRYAFFPLFPMCIRLFAVFLPVEWAAFCVIQLVSLAGIFVLTKLWKLYFPDQEIKALFAFSLLFLFPFSVFFACYYTESLFLLLSACCFLFVKQKRWLLMFAAGFLLCLTRPNGVFIVFPLFLALTQEDLCKRNMRGFLFSNLVPKFCVAAIPLGLASYFVVNHIKTGNWKTFSIVQKEFWKYENASILTNFYNNVIQHSLTFFTRPLHDSSGSQVDYLVMIFVACTLIYMLISRFPLELTLWTGMIWAVPLLTKDLMSFSRYMSISFPLFFMIGLRASKQLNRSMIVLFSIGYFLAVWGIVNYRWVG
ncbi:MAG: hypothetical protein SGI71_08690 [Verrucomicrobiota bacterium]|nr:hypothetical protein [Verrucomicrobiota bacterium]